MLTLTETATRILAQGPEDELRVLKERMRYRPKDYFRADAYQLYKVTDGQRGWDGYRYPFVLRTREHGEALRGRKDTLLKLCQEVKIKVDTTELLVSPFAGLTADQVPEDLIESSFALDTAQKEAVAQWLSHGIGQAHMAVNAGKTATFAAAAALIKRKHPEARFLYFTFTERLVRQGYAAMSGFLPGWHITQYGGGKKDASGADMVVATQAMLSRNFAQLAKDGFFRTFMGLLLDESHHMQSATAERVLLASSAYFRLAASDSTKEADPDKWNKIQGLCGPVRCQVTSTALIASGRSAEPTLYLVDVAAWKNRFSGLSHEPAPGSVAWTFVDGHWIKGQYRGPVFERDASGKVVTRARRRLVGICWVTENVLVVVPGLHLFRADGTTEDIPVPARWTLLRRRYDQAIICFKERNQLIVDWARHFSEQGKPTLVVATRTTHVVILETLLRKALPSDKVRMLFGEDSSKKRDQVFDWFRNTAGAVLVTPLVKEGVSISELRAGIVADVVADVEVARQIIGRFMRRKASDNTCEVVWFVDRQHRSYYAHALKVLEALDAIEGFKFYHPVAGPDSRVSATLHRAQKPLPSVQS